MDQFDPRRRDILLTFMNDLDVCDISKRATQRSGGGSLINFE